MLPEKKVYSTYNEQKLHYLFIDENALAKEKMHTWKLKNFLNSMLRPCLLQKSTSFHVQGR